MPKLLTCIRREVLQLFSTDVWCGGQLFWWRFVVVLLRLRSRDSVVGIGTTLLAG